VLGVRVEGVRREGESEGGRVWRVYNELQSCTCKFSIPTG